MKLSTIALITAASFMSCQFSKKKDDVLVSTSSMQLFEDLRAFASSHYQDRWIISNSSKVFCEFDFETFTPVSKSVRSGQSAQVFYGKNDEITVIIISNSDSGKQLSFRFAYLSEEKSPIFYGSKGSPKHGSQPPQVIGFFIHHLGSSYFISFGETFCIMKLSKDLRAREVARFKANKLTSVSEINYDRNSLLYSETFYKPGNLVSVTRSSTLDDVLSVFGENKQASSMERRFGGLDDESDQPLWINGCHQEWDFDSPPSK